MKKITKIALIFCLYILISIIFGQIFDKGYYGDNHIFNGFIAAIFVTPLVIYVWISLPFNKNGIL